MRKLSEYKNEEALDLLADLLVPLSNIMTDKKIGGKWKKNRIEAVSYIIKNHKKSVIEIMARLENTPVKEYECNMVTLPVQILGILNDTELLGFFNSTLAQKDG